MSTFPIDHQSANKKYGNSDLTYLVIKEEPRKRRPVTTLKVKAEVKDDVDYQNDPAVKRRVHNLTEILKIDLVPDNFYRTPDVTDLASGKLEKIPDTDSDIQWVQPDKSQSDTNSSSLDVSKAGRLGNEKKKKESDSQENLKSNLQESALRDSVFNLLKESGYEKKATEENISQIIGWLMNDKLPTEKELLTLFNPTTSDGKDVLTSSPTVEDISKKNPLPECYIDVSKSLCEDEKPISTSKSRSGRKLGGQLSTKTRNGTSSCHVIQIKDGSGTDVLTSSPTVENISKKNPLPECYIDDSKSLCEDEKPISTSKSRSGRKLGGQLSTKTRNGTSSCHVIQIKDGSGTNVLTSSPTVENISKKNPLPECYIDDSKSLCEDEKPISTSKSRSGRKLGGQLSTKTRNGTSSCHVIQIKDGSGTDVLTSSPTVENISKKNPLPECYIDDSKSLCEDEKPISTSKSRSGRKLGGPLSRQLSTKTRNGTSSCHVIQIKDGSGTDDDDEDDDDDDTPTGPRRYSLRIKAKKSLAEDASEEDFDVYDSDSDEWTPSKGKKKSPEAFLTTFRRRGVHSSIGRDLQKANLQRRGLKNKRKKDDNLNVENKICKKAKISKSITRHKDDNDIKCYPPKNVGTVIVEKTVNNNSEDIEIRNRQCKLAEPVTARVKEMKTIPPTTNTRTEVEIRTYINADQVITNISKTEMKTLTRTEIVKRNSVSENSKIQTTASKTTTTTVASEPRPGEKCILDDVYACTSTTCLLGFSTKHLLKRHMLRMHYEEFLSLRKEGYWDGMTL